MSGMHMGIDLELEIKVRANNMAKIIGRLMQSLGSSDGDVQSAMTRVAEQNIRGVEGIQYSAGEAVGYFEIKIDWDRSRMIVEGPDYRRTLPLNNNLRVEEQVKQQLRKIVEYFEAKRSDRQVDQVKLIYTQSSGQSTPEGFRSLTEHERKELGGIRGRRGFSANPGEYPEMRISYFEL